MSYLREPYCDYGIVEWSLVGLFTIIGLLVFFIIGGVI